MLTAVVDSLPMAVGILVSSIPLMAITLSLLTRSHKGAMLAFLLGWATGVLWVGAWVFLLVEVIDQDMGRPAPGWVNGARLVLGALLLFMALRQWLGRPRKGQVADPPKWMRRLDTLTVGKAGGLGFLLVAINPKNLILLVSGVLSIVAATTLPRTQWTALAVFMVVASLGVASPAIVYWIWGARADVPLERTKAWIARHNSAITACVLLVIGLIVFRNGLTGF